MATSYRAEGAPLVSFVIPVRNDAHGIERCLRSIAAASQGHSVEIIVVDNGSADGSGEVAARLGAAVLSQGGKVSRLRNGAAARSRGDILAFVDADHSIATTWLETAVSLLADPRVGAAGAPYQPPSSANWIQRAYNLLRDHTPGLRDTLWLGSGNLIVRRAAYEAVHGFDESLETCEDVDLCQRLRQAGWKILNDSRLHSTHFGDPSTLRRLFMSELWRGRDNLRVSLREPGWRQLPSVAIPILDLAAAAVGLLALVLGGAAGVPLAIGATIVIAVFACVRAWRMAIRSDSRTGRFWLQVWCVAVLYDIARALALVVRIPHRRTAGPLTSE